MLVRDRPRAAFAQPVESFDSFLAQFRGPRRSPPASIATVYRRAVDGLTPDPNVPELVTAQPEFTTPMWDYIDTRVSDKRIARGMAAMGDQRELFEAAGKAYGVDPYVLGAIWGIETDYGSVLGNEKLIRPIIRSLATLVHQRRTRFEGDTADFIAALKMVQAGPLDRDNLVGSWAGAIGHLQVNPSNIIEHGRDGDGDGKIDLHNSLADALATSATFLRALGYLPGSDWGFEVELPDNFDYTLATRERMRPVRFFADRGVRRIKGQAIHRPGPAGVPLRADRRQRPEIPDDAELSGAQGLQFLRQLRHGGGASDRPAEGRRRLRAAVADARPSSPIWRSARRSSSR